MGAGSGEPTPINRIARFDPDSATWQPLGPGIANGEVLALTEYGGELIVGGTFTAVYAPSEGQGADPPAPPVNIARIARWDGAQWQALTPEAEPNNNVNSLMTLGDELIVAGWFTSIGELSANRIAIWEGAAEQWTALADGLGTAAAIAVYQDELIVGGGFTTLAPAEGAATLGEPAFNIAAWNGRLGAWRAMTLGTDQQVSKLFTSENWLIAYGQFKQLEGASVSRLALSNESGGEAAQWTNMDDGFSGWLSAAVEYNGELVLGGLFSIDDVSYNLARWNPKTQSFSLDSFGSGIDGTVTALTVYEGDLIAAINIMQHDTCNGTAVLRWDPLTQQWEMLASNFGGCEKLVRSMTVHNGDLIIGGMFTTLDGVSMNNIARRDAATGAWHTLSGGLPGYYFMGPPVEAMTVYNGDLIVGGRFVTAGGPAPTGITVNNLARWDGSAWHSMGGVTNVNINYGAWVTSLLVHGEDLVVGGRFAAVGGVSAALIARWSGADGQWHALEGGLLSAALTTNATVDGLAIHNGAIVAAGSFLVADGQVSAHLARWTLPAPQLGDINGDGIVDVDDLLMLLAAWGPCAPAPADCIADIAPQGPPIGDGTVNVDDLLVLLANWG